MAIKGKKRSRSRGSQGARRPAQAPKPTVSGGRRGPAWYRSPLNLGVAIIFGLVVVGITIALVSNARDSAKETSDRRASLESYSDDVNAALQPATSAATELGAVREAPRGEALKSLADDTEEWVTTIEETQSSLAQIAAGPEAVGVNQLFNEALALFASSARTMSTLADIEDRAVREAVFLQAATVRDTANAVFESAITVLNQLRQDVDLGSSGLQSPIVRTTGEVLPEGSTDIVIPGDEQPEDSGDGGGG